jgi:hypothetical protein
MTAAGHDLKGPHFVLTLAGDIHGEESAENREIVRRIHACVNACDGISTDELERGVVQDMRRVIGQIAPLLQDRMQQFPSTAQSSTAPIISQPPRAALRSMQDVY